jgi:putative molybdopterin biosynthesis protein
MGASLICKVREVRIAAGISQQALAERVGISRQALSALEAGRAIPGTDVALKVARALGCQVEALFAESEGPANVEAAWAHGVHGRVNERVVLAEGDHGWVARPADAGRTQGVQAADGVVTRQRGAVVEIELFGAVQAAREGLVVMGCAPALGLLAARLGAVPRRVPMRWIYGTSGDALDALERGEVHMAGIHLRDEETGRYNLPHVERRFARKAMAIVNFASWEQGLVVAKGNPLALRTVQDVVRPRVRLVQREPGAGANKLLEQLLGPKRAPRRPALVARGHLEVAQAVAHGAADVGIAIGSVALAWGLDFIPLSAERFDLVFSEAMAADERVARLIDELGSGSFRRELESLGGYLTAESGHVVAARHRSG